MRSLIYITFSFLAFAAHAASFDCAKANNAAAREICDDTTLSFLDEQMAARYKIALSLVPDKEGFKSNQKDWIANTYQCQADPSTMNLCLLSLYNARVPYLEQVISSYRRELGVNGKSVRLANGKYGYRIDTVGVGSAARQAGLLEGDVIVGIEGSMFETQDSLKSLLTIKKDNVVELAILRNGNVYSSKVAPLQPIADVVAKPDEIPKSPYSTSPSDTSTTSASPTSNSSMNEEAQRTHDSGQSTKKSNGNSSDSGWSIGSILWGIWSFIATILKWVLGIVILGVSLIPAMIARNSLRKGRYYEDLDEFKYYFERMNDSNSSSDEEDGEPEVYETENAAADEYSDRYIRDNWFVILGVEEDASDVEISLAYKSMIRKYHPDKVANLGDEFKEIADKKAKQINQAYQWICKARGI